jgi:hypothetical protein
MFVWKYGVVSYNFFEMNRYYLWTEMAARIKMIIFT